MKMKKSYKLGAFSRTGLFYSRKKLMQMIEDKGFNATANELGLTQSRVFKIYETMRMEPKRAYKRKNKEDDE